MILELEEARACGDESGRRVHLADARAGAELVLHRGWTELLKTYCDALVMVSKGHISRLCPGGRHSSSAMAIPARVE